MAAGKGSHRQSRKKAEDTTGTSRKDSRQLWLGSQQGNDNTQTHKIVHVAWQASGMKDQALCSKKLILRLVALLSGAERTEIKGLGQNHVDNRPKLPVEVV